MTCSDGVEPGSATPDADGPVRRGLVQRGLLGAIGSYQAWRGGRLSPCRFYPSCSAYAAEAVETHGAWRGTALSLRRLARCHPLGGHGIDLVPPAAPTVGDRP